MNYYTWVLVLLIVLALLGCAEGAAPVVNVAGIKGTALLRDTQGHCYAASHWAGSHDLYRVHRLDVCP